MDDVAADAAVGDDGDVESGLTIEQVSRRVDVPIPTIRSWERRHQVPTVSRTSGGHRRYTQEQLDTLRRMRDLVAQGRRAVDAAAQIRAEAASSPDRLIAGFLEAVTGFQESRIGEVLESGHRVLGLGRTVDEVLMPALREIGESWREGRSDVSHEHLATRACQAWLSRLGPNGPPIPGHPPVVLCCAPRDHHTLGLEALGALLRERGWDCLLLGARTPAGSLVRAVRDTSAQAVVLTCHLPSGRQAAVEALESSELTGLHLFYAGGAFASHQARHGVPGRYLGNSLTRAADLVTHTLQQPGPVIE
jgi:methanogenic corrinoid protein MtbC1